jgi:uncharacterized membrane protein
MTQPQQPQQPQQPPTPPPPQKPQTPQTTGLQENVAAMLCYVFWWFSGIAFLVLEPNNKNIKFHAWQSIIISVPIFIVAIIFSVIPGIWFIGTILWVGGWVLLLYVGLMAYQGRKIVVPYAGPLAQKWVEQPPGTGQPPAAK